MRRVSRYYRTLIVTVSADEQEEVQCQYDTTRLKINSNRPDTAKQNSSLYSDYNYQAKYEYRDQQEEEQYIKVFNDLSHYDAKQKTYQAHVNNLPNHDRDENTEDFELLTEINDILPTVIQDLEIRNQSFFPKRSLWSS